MLGKTYIHYLIKWENFANKIVSNALIATLGNKMIVSPIPARELRDTIFNVLTRHKYDSRAFDFVWKAVRKDRPGLTKDAYLKEFIKLKVRPLDTDSIGGKRRKIGRAKRINLFDHMDNEQATLRIAKQIDKQVGVLRGRANRLHKYRVNLTFDKIDGSVGDVTRIVKTFKTKEKNLTKDLNRQLRRLKRAKGEDAKITKTRIAKIKKELSATKKQNRLLSKRLSNFKRRRSSFSDKKAVEAYRKLLLDTENIIVKREQKDVIKAIIDKATRKVSSIAQTEKTRAGSVKAEKKIDKIERAGKMAEVTISLSGNHDIVDICDDLTGTYDSDKIPSEGLPPYHTNCECRVTVRIKKQTKE